MYQIREVFSYSGNALVHRLMAVLLADSFADQRSNLSLRHTVLMEHSAAYDDLINGYHLRQVTINLLLEEAISDIFFHTIRVSHFFADKLQRFHWNGIAATMIRAIGTIAHANVPSRSVAFSCPLQLLPLLPEGAHDFVEFFMGQGRFGRVTGKIVGLGRTGFDFLFHEISSVSSVTEAEVSS